MADLPGWPWWKVISITGQSGAGPDYQVKLTIGDSAGGDFHLEGHCTNFPQDIRITDDDGTTLLDHWVEDITADPIVVHVEVKDDLGSNRDIRVYYGKSGESTASDIKTTMTFGDEFDYSGDPDPSRWDVTESAAGNLNVGSGVCTITGNTGWNTNGMLSDVAFDRTAGNFVMEAKYKTTGSGDAAFIWGYSIALGNGYYSFYNPNTLRYRTTTWHVFSTAIPSDGTYYRNKIISTAANSITYEYVSESHIYASSSNNGKVMLNTYSAKTTTVDFVFVRKYNDPEPAFSSAGAEQTPTGVAPTGVFYGPLIGPFGGPI